MPRSSPTPLSKRAIIGFATIACLLLPKLSGDETDSLPSGEAERIDPSPLAAQVVALLETRCVGCHGVEQQEGDLRLDSREAAIRGGGKGPAISPGEPEKSLIVLMIGHREEKDRMPPDDPLAPDEIEKVKNWILGGAKWPTTAIPDKIAELQAPREVIGDAWSDPHNPIVRLFGGKRIDLWSFRPIRAPEIPSAVNTSWVINTIDAFVLSQLEGRGLAPSAEASRRTLIRRLTFDLTGLPPTPERVAAFEADARPDSYERLVDELLESPAYGEHMARMWLDVVRYSDSNGFDWDEFRPQAYRYRDYVIRSFNRDKPFDRFILEQLAGDELLQGPPQTEDERDCWIATGYLRMGPQDNSAPLFNEQERARYELMADLVETTGSAMLGMTLACCRCHDHKTDPLSQADHYRFRAFFEGVRYGDDVPLNLSEEQARITAHNAEVEQKISAIQAEKDAILKNNEAVNNIAEAKENGAEGKEPDLAEADRERIKVIDAAIADERKNMLPFDHGLVMTDTAESPKETHLLLQGDYRQPRDVTPPGFFSALDPNAASLAKAASSNTLGRRLTLARWIISNENPLTSRVIVNRIWQMHFGQGLVASPNDFGLSGEAPSNFELLDHLAVQFMREGWSIKALHKRMVCSAAYRQRATAAYEGDNPSAPYQEGLVARQSIRRLTAEQLRDALLTVSGLLTDKSQGPPIWPDLPLDVLQANPAFLDDNETKTKGWYPSPPEEQYARSIFLVQKRTCRVPFMETFDLPENATSCGRRNVSTVAPQAMSLLNSPLASQCAHSLARRITSDVGADDRNAQLSRAFQLALQRSPTVDELADCAVLLDQAGLPAVCRVLLNLNEFAYLE